jgi:succinate-semialdehyde dehydrogenase/glutarate-semialdehyde dehydrogenase
MIESPLLANLGGYIGGEWVGATSGATFAVINPATGEQLAAVPEMGATETTAAVEAASRALDDRTSAEQRRDWLNLIHDGLLEHKQELARIITLEHGKPLKESVGEVEYSAGFFDFFARQLGHLEPETLPERIRGCRWVLHRRPAGVAGLIAPWNFPLAMMAKKIAPAIGAGCSVVVKPASLTPLTAIAFFAVAQRAGLTAGLRHDRAATAAQAGRLNLVMGKSGPIGDVLCRHPGVRVISFTGSTEVGRLLIAKTAPHVKRLALELGGNAPFIVFEDADIEAAADGLVANKFRAAGQTCVCTNRVYADRRVIDSFTQAVAERVRRLRVGDGLAPDTDVGPLIDRAGFDKVAEHVRDALRRGARRIVGDDPPRPEHDWGAFYPPTVLLGVTPEMLVCREETFGPVVAIGTFDDERQVIELANSTDYGLAAYVFTRDAERADRVIAQLRFGHVGLNTGTGPTSEAPFGGMKQSGFGREGGVEGLLEFCETQVVASA